MPDGSYAFVRHEGSAVITLVELATGMLSSVALSGPVTDLDLVSDAKSALAVVRGSAIVPADDAQAGAGGDHGENAEAAGAGGEGGTADAGAPNGGAGGAPNPADPRSTLVILPIPGIFSAPTSFESVSIAEQFGLVNIAPEGTAALLYTNAVASSHLTVLETAPGDTFLHYRTVDLHGLVRDVYPSPDGAYAIASLNARDAAGSQASRRCPSQARCRCACKPRTRRCLPWHRAQARPRARWSRSATAPPISRPTWCACRSW